MRGGGISAVASSGRLSNIAGDISTPITFGQFKSRKDKSLPRGQLIITLKSSVGKKESATEIVFDVAVTVTLTNFT
jgi:hypothetical protein